MTLKIYLLELFQFLILIPAAFFCYLPMKNQLNCSVKKIMFGALIIFLICTPPLSLINIYFKIDSNFTGFFLIAVCFFYYHSTLKTDLSRSLAIYVFSCCLFSFPTNLSFTFDALLYPSNTYLQYGWEASIFRLIIALLLTALFAFPLQKYGSYLIDNLLVPRVWFLTLPVCIMFVGTNIIFIPHNYQTIHVGRIFPISIMLQILLLFLYIFLSVIFYFIAVEMLEKVYLMERHKFFKMQEKQYIAQKKYIEDIQKMRHDMRQSIHVLYNLAKREDLESIENYLTEYEASLPSSAYTKYCANNAVDALLNYYARQEYENEIRMNWQIDLPEHISVLETDLCSLIGNLIENAIAGCLTTVSAERNHSLTIVVKNKTRLYIVSTNTFDGTIKQINGTYISTKKENGGIGISSISMTAAKYDGVAKFHHTDDKFFADIMLKI